MVPIKKKEQLSAFFLSSLFSNTKIPELALEHGYNLYIHYVIVKHQHTHNVQWLLMQ